MKYPRLLSRILQWRRLAAHWPNCKPSTSIRHSTSASRRRPWSTRVSTAVQHSGIRIPLSDYNCLVKTWGEVVDSALLPAVLAGTEREEKVDKLRVTLLNQLFQKGRLDIILQKFEVRPASRRFRQCDGRLGEPRPVRVPHSEIRHASGGPAEHGGGGGRRVRHRGRHGGDDEAHPQGTSPTFWCISLSLSD